MEAVAKLKNCPTSPRKMRLVVDQIRKQDVETALNILRYSPKEASRRLEKLLLSGIANWQNRNEGERVEDSELFVKAAFVDSARMLKRFQPRAQGRGFRIRKRSNHVTLIIDSKLPIQADETKAIEETAGKVLEEVKTTETTKASPTKTKATPAKKSSPTAKPAAPTKSSASAKAKTDKPADKEAAPKKASSARAKDPKTESTPKKTEAKKDAKKDNGTKS